MLPDIAVLHQDDALLVLNKPSGLLSVPGRGPDKQDCLSARVQQHFPGALVVHRLDMATSGLVVMARTPEAQKRLNAAFSERQVDKRYTAVVHGNCSLAEPAHGALYPDPQGAAPWHTIDLPIGLDWPQRPRRKIDPVHGQASTTRWRCLGWDAATNASRLELVALTGRTHQLRLHLQALGHPILGDALYASAPVAAQSSRLLLHAHALGLAHPHTGTALQLDCPCPF